MRDMKTYISTMNALLWWEYIGNIKFQRIQNYPPPREKKGWLLGACCLVSLAARNVCSSLCLSPIFCLN
jgi:hypothetical protein